jgi:hypothetical protein
MRLQDISLKDLQELPTICKTALKELKVNTAQYRVWIYSGSCGTLRDYGYDSDAPIAVAKVERNINGEWYTVQLDAFLQHDGMDEARMSIVGMESENVVFPELTIKEWDEFKNCISSQVTLFASLDNQLLDSFLEIVEETSLEFMELNEMMNESKTIVWLERFMSLCISVASSYASSAYRESLVLAWYIISENEN